MYDTGAEISPAMYQAAAAFNQAFIDAKLAEYALYDGFRLPFADKQFHATFSVNVLYFWQDPAALFAELARVLQDGGRLCVSFCERAFMQKLPFARFGFAHYNATKVIALAAHVFDLVWENRRNDWAVSKSGALVKRETVHLLFGEI
ncbi:class I SAM-dependent methyltransferase [Neisseria chenwenguii]|uniref:class I SAM-dependent methyltransferase n=1 Tax=Neisseria chenwenguii TaxID=1853278 RepID=UPI001E6431FA|nr:methyltransferase domain-containing protein [Neisseria chenwenguii]